MGGGFGVKVRTGGGRRRMVREREGREGGREEGRKKGGRKKGGQAGRELEGVGRVMGLRVRGEENRIGGGGAVSGLCGCYDK